MDVIEQLQKRMNEAAEAGDFETAGLLRDAIERLKTGQSNLTEQKPGRMGLGSSQESYVGEDKPLPKKPDFLTKNHRPGGRRR